MASCSLSAQGPHQSRSHRLVACQRCRQTLGRRMHPTPKCLLIGRGLDRDFPLDHPPRRRWCTPNRRHLLCAYIPPARHTRLWRDLYHTVAEVADIVTHANSGIWTARTSLKASRTQTTALFPSSPTLAKIGAPTAHHTTEGSRLSWFKAPPHSVSAGPAEFSDLQMGARHSDWTSLPRRVATSDASVTSASAPRRGPPARPQTGPGASRRLSQSSNPLTASESFDYDRIAALSQQTDARAGDCVWTSRAPTASRTSAKWAM